MRRKYDLAVKVGEYQDSYNRTRARWKNIGSLMVDDKGGEFIMLDKYVNYALLGEPDRDSILVSLFDVKERGSSSGQAPQQVQQAQQAQQSFNSNMSVQAMRDTQIGFDIGQPMGDNPLGIPF